MFISTIIDFNDRCENRVELMGIWVENIWGASVSMYFKFITV